MQAGKREGGRAGWDSGSGIGEGVLLKGGKWYLMRAAVGRKNEPSLIQAAELPVGQSVSNLFRFAQGNTRRSGEKVRRGESGGGKGKIQNGGKRREVTVQGVQLGLIVA